ncbi:hypothetical protein CRG98_007553 [Punica granatum]|uniref:Uncharacterized protein n=1 Tax=Punica granatum TaxID=22663 RepID=A0A2I0KUB0_PUNGR|nr:hypothetical protein CRG98_007553 [Punica granatum]
MEHVLVSLAGTRSRTLSSTCTTSREHHDGRLPPCGSEWIHSALSSTDDSPQPLSIVSATPTTWWHPILAHRFPTGGLPTKTRDTIHHPAIKGERAVTKPRAIGEEHGPPRKAEESHQKNRRTRNPENDGAGIVALFITESPKHRKVPNMGL